MPAESEKQRRFMGAELGRLREGKKTQTGMSEEKLKEFASKPIQKEFFDHMEETYGFEIEKGGQGSGRRPINQIWPKGKPMRTAGKGAVPDKEHPRFSAPRKPWPSVSEVRGMRKRVRPVR